MIVVKQKKSQGGKKIRNARKLIDVSRNYGLEEAISFLKENKISNFDETLEIALNLGVNTAHSDQMVRGVVDMPNGIGKKIRVAALVKPADEEKAKKAGAGLVGLEEIINSIKSGDIAFDVCVATPDVMPKIAPIAKILGPRGLMPNPKLGTVAVDVETAIKKVLAGQVEYRADKGGVVHAGVGKVSFSVESLCQNVNALIAAVIKSKPAAAKGNYIKSIFMSSTMGPSVSIDVASVN